MSEPVELRKKCHLHGELLPQDIFYQKAKNMASGGYARCAICKTEAYARWISKNREKHSKSSSDYCKNNREKINAWTRADRRKDPEKYRRREREKRQRRIALQMMQRFLKKTGYTIAEYTALLRDFNNTCGICGYFEEPLPKETFPTISFVVDGVRGTKEPRGLLCYSCHSGLNAFKESVALLEKAIDYLPDRGIDETISHQAGGAASADSGGEQVRAL